MTTKPSCKSHFSLLKSLKITKWEQKGTIQSFDLWLPLLPPKKASIISLEDITITAPIWQKLQITEKIKCQKCNIWPKILNLGTNSKMQQIEKKKKIPLYFRDPKKPPHPQTALASENLTDQEKLVNDKAKIRTEKFTRNYSKALQIHQISSSNLSSIQTTSSYDKPHSCISLTPYLRFPNPKIPKTLSTNHWLRSNKPKIKYPQTPKRKRKKKLTLPNLLVHPENSVGCVTWAWN